MRCVWAVWVLCVGVMLSAQALALPQESLTLEQVLDASLAHFPEIQKAKSKREASEASVQAALGAFDLSLDNGTDVRTAGYYTGKQTSSKIVKPFADFNARVSAGYRVSDGSFPIYDDEFNTNRGGEFNLDVFLSLLRDRDIDDDRLALWNNRLKVTQAKQEELLAKISTQHAAMKAYYEWLAAGEILRVQEELLGLAKERQQGLVTRAQHGDIAKILITENMQNIYRREGLLNDAKRLFANAAANIALYWRDADGNMLTPGTYANPRLPKPNSTIVLPELKELATVYQARPEFTVIDAELEQQQNELKAGENRLLPRADLSVKTARDTGAGSITQRQTENIVGLNVSIPLENNTADGRISRAKANLKALEYERQFLRNKIAQQLQFIDNDIQAASRFIDISANEVAVADKMQNSERQIFNQGGSDFFLLNMREEQLANARIKNIYAQLEYYKVQASYYAAAVKLDKLRITTN